MGGQHCTLGLTHEACRAQTSLAQFNGLYVNAIDTAERAAMPSKHIANIISTLTWDIYLYVARGLYESHKIVFALMLANKVLLTAGKVRQLLRDMPG